VLSSVQISDIFSLRGVSVFFMAPEFREIIQHKGGGEKGD